MLIATIILNKYQEYLFNIFILVFNNILQCILESFACSTRLFLRIQVPWSSQVRLSLLVQLFVFYPDLVDCMYSLSPGTFLSPSKPFQGAYEDFHDGRITVSFLAKRYRKIEVSIFRYFPS